MPSGWDAGPLVALIPVRRGELPAGAHEVFAEAGGRGLLAGTGTLEAAGSLRGDGEVACTEIGDYAPARWAATLAPLLAAIPVIVAPASADGRDLAPRLAHRLGRRLHAGAVHVTAETVVVARHDWSTSETYAVDGDLVTTLLPGVRGDDDRLGHPAVVMLTKAPSPGRRAPQNGPSRAAGYRPSGGDAATGPDPVMLDQLAADPATIDLTEAHRVISGGAGLGDPSRFALLSEVAAALGASPGATRVVADAGWVPHHRYIGTTGVTVHPSLYVAIGISGAVQHVTGVRHPGHVIAVNTDPSAPMMAMAELAVVTDGPALLEALADRLGVESPERPTSVTP